jgi:hypothetical protein
MARRMIRSTGTAIVTYRACQPKSATADRSLKASDMTMPAADRIHKPDDVDQHRLAPVEVELRLNTRDHRADDLHLEGVEHPADARPSLDDLSTPQPRTRAWRLLRNAEIFASLGAEFAHSCPQVFAGGGASPLKKVAKLNSRVFGPLGLIFGEHKQTASDYLC